MTLFQDILEKIQGLSPRALVVDSIQTVYLKGVVGSAGNIQQVRSSKVLDLILLYVARMIILKLKKCGIAKQSYHSLFQKFVLLSVSKMNW